MSGTDPGVFLGEGAPVRNGVTDFFCRIPVVLESCRSAGGGGGAHPLNPPPRSAPACSLVPNKIYLVFPCSLKVFLLFWCSLFPKLCFCSRVPSFIFLLFPCPPKSNWPCSLVPTVFGMNGIVAYAFTVLKENLSGNSFKQISSLPGFIITKLDSYLLNYLKIITLK